MAYTRKDMVFFNYGWKTSEKPHESGVEAQTELNRDEGFEMLNYINGLAKTWGWHTDNLTSFRHLERIIRNEVPGDIRTHADILAWIEDHYTNV